MQSNSEDAGDDIAVREGRLTVWHPSWSVGHDALDHQHRKIIDTANAVAGLDGSEAEALIDAVLEEAIDYASRHFAHEEDALGAIQWPGLALHAVGHDALRRDILAAGALTGSERVAAVQAVMHALLVHISTVDTDYRGAFPTPPRHPL